MEAEPEVWLLKRRDGTVYPAPVLEAVITWKPASGICLNQEATETTELGTNEHKRQDRTGKASSLQAPITPTCTDGVS